MRGLLSLTTVVMLASACTTVPRYPPAAPTPLVPFNAEETRWAEAPGSGTIEGQGFLKTRGGDVKYGAGEAVHLIPNAPHSFDWFARMTAGKVFPPDLDPGLRRLVRTTTAGGDGRFKFENVPPGPYLVITKVSWEVPGAYSARKQGGYIGTTVIPENGKTTNVIITR